MLLNSFKTYNYLIVLMISLGYVLTQTYNITGKVLDIGTNKVIENANVYIENSDFGTLTDEDGFFVLNLNNQLENTVTLNVKIIGYIDEIILLDLSKPKVELGEVFLTAKSLDLEPVHIHSHKDQSKQISNISLAYLLF